MTLTTAELTQIVTTAIDKAFVKAEEAVSGHAYSGFLTHALEIANAEIDKITPDVIDAVAKDLGIGQ